MTAFTILGILTYWLLMGCIGYSLGYALGVYVDMRRGIRRLCEVDRKVDATIAEIGAIVTWMTAYGAASADGGEA